MKYVPQLHCEGVNGVYLVFMSDHIVCLEKGDVDDTVFIHTVAGAKPYHVKGTLREINIRLTKSFTSNL